MVARKREEMDGSEAVQLSKDAVKVLGEASKVFLHCLSATANELCAGRQRSTGSEQGVHGAFAELAFDALLPALARNCVSWTDKAAREVFSEGRGVGLQSERRAALAARVEVAAVEAAAVEAGTAGRG